MDFKIKNFTMGTFNNDVNHSGNLEEKYLRWASYRQKINDFILKSIEDKKYNNIIVLGAGECNDLDLKFLTNTFESINLSDIDIASIEEGIDRQKLPKNAKAKIELIQQDYTGLDKLGFFQHITDLINMKKTEKEISSYIKKAITDISDFDILLSHKNKYSMVLVLPTYTQLAYTQMEALLKILYQYNIYEVDDLNRIITSMYHTMPAIINNYNNLILSLLANDGILILLSDILEITDMEIKENLANKINDTEYIKDYLSTDCSDLAQIGLDDLRGKIDILHGTYALWPFNESKDYIVNMLAGCNRE